MPSSYDEMQGTSEAVPTPALSLEQRVEEQGHMLAELRSLMERLTSMERSATTSPSRRSGIPRPRLAEPPRFSGDRSEGRAFIDAISLYYLSADFDSDASAITWALFILPDFSPFKTLRRIAISTPIARIMVLPRSLQSPDSSLQQFEELSITISLEATRDGLVWPHDCDLPHGKDLDARL